MEENISTREETTVGENKMRVLETAVDELYSYNDQYFEHHDLNEANLKNKRINDRLDDVLKTFGEYKAEVLASPENRANYWYQLGRAQNVLPSFSVKAEEALAKAVKLDPKLIPAWNQLGECYWKKDNFQEAKNCFQGALSQSENKVSLRNLSILARQDVAENLKEKAKNVEQGVTLARQAVQIDTNDGVSWSILGNAYLVQFFTMHQNAQSLKLAMSAYAQAEKDPAAKNSPDLHYNKAIAYKYEEKYEEALVGFTRAKELDPTWDAPRTKQQQLLRFLDNILEMARTKGKLKAKRLNFLLQSIDNKHLGPFADGSFKTNNGKSCRLEHVHLNDLNSGLNSEKVVLGKVICSVHDDDSVPFTFCIIDKQQTVIPVMLYNLSEGKGVIIGDSVAIPEPLLKCFQFTFNSKVYKFNSIRVNSPLVLVVNGKALSKDYMASVQFSTFTLHQ